jgi:PAS domain-containing protein
MTDGVYIVNQEYDIKFVNPAITKEFGPFDGKTFYTRKSGAQSAGGAG